MLEKESRSSVYWAYSFSQALPMDIICIHSSRMRSEPEVSLREYFRPMTAYFPVFTSKSEKDLSASRAE